MTTWIQRTLRIKKLVLAMTANTTAPYNPNRAWKQPFLHIPVYYVYSGSVLETGVFTIQ